MREESPVYAFTCDLCGGNKNSKEEICPDGWTFVKLKEVPDATINEKYKHVCASCSEQVYNLA